MSEIHVRAPTHNITHTHTHRFHSDTTTETSNKAELITSLKQLYSSSSPGRLESHDQSHDMEHHQDIEMEEACPDEEQG